MEESPLSRRDFLRLSGSTTVGFIGSRLPTIPSQEFNSLQEKSWELDEILDNPIQFIDDFSARMIEAVGEEDLSYTQKRFIEEFATQEHIIKNADGTEIKVKNTNREIIRNGYAEYGTRIKSLLHREKTLNAFPIYEGFSHAHILRSMDDFWKPLNNLNSGIPYGEYEVPLDVLVGLMNTLNWLAPITYRSNYESQKELYLLRGISNPDESTLQKNINNLWEDIREAPYLSAGYLEEIDDDFKFIVFDSFKKHFPTALAGFTNMNFEDYNGRAFFAETLDGAHISLGNSYWAFSKRLDWDKKHQNQWEQYNSQVMLDKFLAMFIHEVSHKYDPTRAPSIDMASIHPADYFDYLDCYMDMFESFYSEVHQMTAGDLRLWFIDPLSPKLFGVDQLESSDQWDSLDNEFDLLSQVARYMETEEGAELYEKVGMGEIFKGEGGSYLNWMVKEDAKFNGWASHVPNLKASMNYLGIDYKPEKFSLNEINKLRTLLDSLKGNENYSTKVVKQALLEMKSFYLFSAFVTLEKAREERILTGEHPLNPQYIKLYQTINYHLVHLMTGPLGQYTPLYKQDQNLHVSAEEMLRTNKETADMSAARSFYSEKNSIQAIDSIREHVVRAQALRAKMWGGDINNFVKFANEVSGELGIEITDTLSDA